MKHRLVRTPADKNRRITGHDDERDSLALKRLLQVCAILIFQKEIDQSDIDHRRLQCIDGFTGGFEGPNDGCTATLQIAGMIRSDDIIVLRNKNIHSLKVFNLLWHGFSFAFRR